MLFNIDDVENYEKEYGLDKDPKPKGNEKGSDFKLFDSMVNGDMRPFLKKYSSKSHIEKLIKKLWTISFFKDEDGIIKNIPEDDELFEIIGKDGDEFELLFDETNDQERPRLTNITYDKLEELIDIDIPPPPDLKAEYFLDLIEIEYKKIKIRADKVLQTSSNEDQISLYANKNIQKLKVIAGQAHLLSKRLRTKDQSTWDEPDSYIIYILKTYIIRSILFYQELFQPYIKTSIQDEIQLKMALYEARSPQDFEEDLNQKVKNKFYKNLNNEIQVLRKKPNYNGLDLQISRLKILTLKKEWLNNVAKEAILNGFIGLSHLVFIMASDENYTKNLILTQLIENIFSEKKNRLGTYSDQQKLLTSDCKSRIDVWRMLINHWVRGNFPIFKDEYNTYLSFYCIDSTTKDFKGFDLKEKYDQLIQKRLREKSDELTLKEQAKIGKLINDIPRFLKLSELKICLSDVIGIPLPSTLFPDNTLVNLDEELKVKNFRPSQKARIECRAIAKKIWKKNPKITIAVMINHQELIPYTIKKDGNFYTEKTVRNWIKDLCPDRSRGRRKGT